ncbi:MAG TPA: recombinase family protein [Chitinophagaceae bacterium]|nr:recombinase family protein [Chitinophagaceae bacterium]
MISSQNLQVMKKKYVAYYRVSTNKQEYGVDAQRTAVRNFSGCTDGSCIEKEFVEIESGRNNKRVALQEALDHCKKHKCTLIISKLDRLSRNVAFLFNLQDAGVNFHCVDLPKLDTLTLGIFATFAQFEAERISIRTKEALAARKAKGLKKRVVNNLTKERIKAGHAAIKENARNAKEVVQTVDQIKDKRKSNWTYRAIADYLNKKDFTTRGGTKFNAIQVQRIDKRFQN